MRHTDDLEARMAQLADIEDARPAAMAALSAHFPENGVFRAVTGRFGDLQAPTTLPSPAGPRYHGSWCACDACLRARTGRS